MNKKFVGIGIGIVIVIIILISMQSYPVATENAVNQSSVQFPNATLQKPLNAGKHITVELTESMHLASP